MKLLANTVLCHNDDRMGYEILRTQDMLLFQPYYHQDLNFPSIVLSRFNSTWQFEETVDKNFESQILEDIQCLRVNSKTAALVN